MAMHMYTNSDSDPSIYRHCDTRVQEDDMYDDEESSLADELIRCGGIFTGVIVTAITLVHFIMLIVQKNQ